jgi:hypothetical protein
MLDFVSTSFYQASEGYSERSSTLNGGQCQLQLFSVNYLQFNASCRESPRRFWR